MASTPASSFSNEEGHTKGRAQAIPFKLPSPAQSNSDLEAGTDTHEHDDSRGGVREAFDTIWDTFCGLPTPACPTFDLRDQPTYEQLHHRLSQQPGLLEFFEYKVRKDWNADTGKLTLRLMASCLHDMFKEDLGDAIKEELHRVARECPSLMPFRKKIKSGGHTKVQKGKGKSGAARFERSPDGQFRYPGVKYPYLIFEVGYSQDERSLRKVVAEYFEEVVDTVCTFLTFDIDYADPAQRRVPGHFHPASVSLWVSEQDFGYGEDDDYDLNIKCLMDTVVFRDEAGNAREGELVLPFKVFIPAEEHANLPPEATDAAAQVRISFEHLSELVHSAEQGQRDLEADIPASRVKKVRWLGTSGTVTREKTRASEPKRRRTGSPSPSPSLSRPRTRSASRPRRSERLRSTSRSDRA